MVLNLGLMSKPLPDSIFWRAPPADAERDGTTLIVNVQHFGEKARCFIALVDLSHNAMERIMRWAKFDIADREETRRREFDERHDINSPDLLIGHPFYQKAR
ncbi:hypothetical protein M231_03311 [Tremella mesenterica]|uniref:Uncharacterized protein n=1 Tax=Tremella mesenterica TaxID=5217 RepID=A0A4Q1BNC3_TREME|nr:uncharacterized protein TREMEDRAFT_62143 [Tremella mesenterica DSM 1558]EIW69281.1 hypothetical protein TREMEDRAFT_62143 [Tremella mesenterica DSM 1558]RXK39359.1 hypothetical protein M231_03311 [Tremella mesenterica]